MTHTITDQELAQLLRQHALEEEEGMASCMTLVFGTVCVWCVLMLFGWGVYRLVMMGF